MSDKILLPEDYTHSKRESGQKQATLHRSYFSGREVESGKAMCLTATVSLADGSKVEVIVFDKVKHDKSNVFSGMLNKITGEFPSLIQIKTGKCELLTSQEQVDEWMEIEAE